jgi:phage/plasmid-like protein (TIGR03299 family)
MTANIFGERFYGTRKPAWHGLGKVFEKAITPGAAVVEVGLDYSVEKFPLYARVGKDKNVKTDKVAIMRTPTADDPQYKVFGMAGSKYELIQNVQLASIMEPLAKVWPLETAGAVAEGKTVFMSFNTGGADIEGDPINGYFLLVDVKDGGTATKLIYTPVRVVCQNTLVSGLRQATVNISIQHTVGSGKQLEARINLLAKAKSAIDETTLIFRQLATTKVTSAQVNKALEVVYPLPAPRDDLSLQGYSKEDLGDLLFKSVGDAEYALAYYTEKAEERRKGAAELYTKLNDEYPKLGATAWHLYNAVVESADYRDGKNVEVSALFGGRAKEKQAAFVAARALIK